MAAFFERKEKTMTLKEAIDKIDALKPNAYTDAEKRRWLSELDGKIHRELIRTHTGWDGAPGEAYSAEDENRELLIAFPYEEVYMKYLAAQIDFSNGDIGRYKKSIQAFYTEDTDFSNWYTRTHLPKGAYIRL